jgi:hypothetical protein
MEALRDILAFVIVHHLVLVEGLVLILTGVILIAALIPGEQPEKALQKIVDLLKKLSRK